MGRAELVGRPGAAKGLVSAASGPSEARCSWRGRLSAGFEDGCGGDIRARVVGFPIPTGSVDPASRTDTREIIKLRQLLTVASTAALVFLAPHQAGAQTATLADDTHVETVGDSAARAA